MRACGHSVFTASASEAFEGRQGMEWYDEQWESYRANVDCGKDYGMESKHRLHTGAGLDHRDLGLGTVGRWIAEMATHGRGRRR